MTTTSEHENNACLDRAARFIERFAQRLANGPAVREFTAPINRILYEAEDLAIIVPLLNALASGVRAGLDPESDWPDAPVPHQDEYDRQDDERARWADVVRLSTADPLFAPTEPVIVNGYRYAPEARA